MGRKRQAAEPPAGDVEHELELEEVEAPKPQRKKSPKKKYTDSMVDDMGWTLEPPSLIWRSFGAVPGSAKIAAFNLDSTLVNRKSASIQLRNADDWKWWNAVTPNKLLALMQDGYKVVVFTNQASIGGALEGVYKEKVAGMLERMYNHLVEVCEQGDDGVNVGLQCFIAPSKSEMDPFRKPSTGMWTYMVQNCNDSIAPDLKRSFYVGDGSGLVDDHSDRVFAETIGIPFKMPEEVFGPVAGKVSIGREAVRAASMGIATGANPNAGLVMQMKALAAQAKAAAKAGHSDKNMHWKAKAFQRAADTLSTFPEEICEDNLKAVNALQGVGKTTMERIKAYLATGSIMLPEELEEQGALNLV